MPKEKDISNYIKEKPVFLSIIRELEGQLYKKHLALVGKTLDFGCGDGYFAKQFFPRKIDIGIDVDPSLKTRAQSSNAYKRIMFFNGKKLPFPDNYFDTIVSNCVLEHIPNLADNLKEISRVLRPKGKFYATVMENKWNEFLFGRIFLGNLYSQWMRHKQVHHNLLTEKDWRALFAKNNLRTTVSFVYLNERLSRLIDIFHYLGIMDLISFKLLGKWVLFPAFRSKKIFAVLLDWGKKDQKKGGAVFFICQKK
jgi:SAM-dependent methyltransferase